MHIPDKNCLLCPRLCGFREENRAKFPGYYNAPVPSFGELDSELLVVGLAPGLHGANQTGRPFTGDYAGFTLYESLQKGGFAEGNYFATLPDTLDIRMKAAGDVNGQGEFKLINCRITNAVRCVPQANKPEPSEIKNCNTFLHAEIAAMPNLKAILSLGLVSHNAVLRALGMKASAAKFAHGAIHRIQDSGCRIQEEKKNIPSPDTRNPNPESLFLFDSYHCSRYNINTGRLNQAMFDVVVARIAQLLSD
jgi:uracil-DNA glycosylase